MSKQSTEAFCTGGACAEVVRSGGDYYILDNKGESRDTSHYRFGAFVLSSAEFADLTTAVSAANESDAVAVASAFMVDRSADGNPNIAEQVYDQPGELEAFAGGLRNGAFDNMEDGESRVADSRQYADLAGYRSAA